MHRSSLAALLRSKRLIICVGCGGVGKTTTAAALALSSAELGRRAAVITVDPAKRLKSALGLDTLSHEPHRVKVNGGRVAFDALALDTKRMFDQLVERLAPDQATAERIFANRLYRELSNELAGSAEYMAMEKLHDLVCSGAYETLIVDTPPSAHIHDLLAAPNRLLTLLASRAVRLLQAPSRLVEGATSRTARFALRTLLEALQRWSGLPLLKDLADFVNAFESMLASFANRAEVTAGLLRDAGTVFLLVTTPEPHTMSLGQAFLDELRAGGYPVAGIVANRVHMFASQTLPESVGPDPFTRRLWQNYRALAARSQRDAEELARLVKKAGLPILARVPVQATPPCSLSGLAQVAEHLLADQP
ncbi:MAG: AAA family ATPase [Candidatus Binatia bacterium]|nr:AAA family ATPase [Candidatus Binatia bacterium]